MINRKYLDELQEVLEDYSFQLSFEELLKELSNEAEEYAEVNERNV